MFTESFFSEILSESRPAITYAVSRRLCAIFPERAIVETEEYSFDLESFARAGHCRLQVEPGLHSEIRHEWSSEDGVTASAVHAWYGVEWRGRCLEVVLVTLPDEFHPIAWIIAEHYDAARAFLAAVCAFEPEVTGEVLLFEQGCWTRKNSLFREIQSAREENLILPAAFKSALFSELDRFFAAHDDYARLGVPWKRGLLFTGPPGNGKTFAIKSLLRAAGKPCLYVKSFESERTIEPTNIRRVFERARRTSPCVLVLEDLDSLVNRNNLSFFLNEVDGIASNHGLAILATSNHPEKLDSALRNRPSRFDRTYHFGLPELCERVRYLEAWNSRAASELRLVEYLVQLVARETEGLSFASLQELCLAVSLAYASGSRDRTVEQIFLELAKFLVTSGAGSAAHSDLGCGVNRAPDNSTEDATY
jgi:hypothetical protein